MTGGSIAALIPWDWLAWLAGGLVSLLGAWVAGRRSGAVRADLKGLREYQSTRKAMDDAEANLGDDPDLARRWLRERSKSSGDL